jgi:basic membrane protein A
MTATPRAAVWLAVTAALVTSAAASGATRAATPAPRVAVVLQADGCPPETTVAVCEGIARAMRLTGVRGRIVTPTRRESIGDFLALTAQQGYDAIVLAGVGTEPGVTKTARRFPRVPFVILQVSRTELKNPPANIQGLMIQAREAAFLAGWLAAKLERRRPGPDTVGVVGGWEADPVTDFVDGFAAGARLAAPRVKVLVDYANDFVDQDKCAALARRQITRGAGTVFNVAGACGLGAMKAAADAGVWAVGVDSDQSFLGPHVLTSVLKNFDAAFVEIFEQVKRGRVRTGRDTVVTMSEGAAGLGKISPRVPRGLVTQLEDLRRKIVAGTLRVRAR